MTGADNTSVILYCYLRTLSVKVSRDTVHRLLSTPLGGGMRGISDALDALHVKTEVVRLLSHDYFLRLETPFITMLEVDKKSFCVVSKMTCKGRQVSTALDRYSLIGRTY